MRSLAAALARWGIRYFLAFVFVVAVLAAGKLVLDELAEFRQAEKEIAELTAGRQDVHAHLGKLQADLQTRAAGLAQAPVDLLAARIQAIDKEILRLSEARAAGIGWLSSLPGPGFVDRIRRDAELKLLVQEKEFLAAALSTAETLQKGPAHLETLRRRHAAAYEKLQQNELERRQVAAAHPWLSRVPLSLPYRQLEELNEAHEYLAGANAFAHRNYERQRLLIESATTAKRELALRLEKVDDSLRPLDAVIAEREQRNFRNWVRKARDLVAEVMPAALLVLASILLLPAAIKALFYFVLAPLAARRPAVRLLPDASGTIEVAQGTVSAVAVPVTIGADEEMLVHPEYLQSSPASAAKRTKWLLDWSYPLSSLAAGMVALVRIRASEPQTVVVSAKRDPLSEVGVLGLPAGAAIVLQPRSLVAVVFRRAVPLRISTHWRLGSLHAWLTLQLRYVVFHGPSRLIVKGCRGVRVEKADAGRRIDQAATIGFSANLAYSTTRCDTFAAYLMGEQALLVDRFAGEDGVFVYEETQRDGVKGGVSGRGLEGLADSLLKIFGL